MNSLSPDATAPPTRIFLTGGSGYVGRNLIRHFVEKGIAVSALARSRDAIATVSTLGAIPISGDVFVADLVAGMSGCDALIHAAADTNHGYGGKEQHTINVEGTRRVFEAAREAGIGRAILISTESVLLDGTSLVDADETRPYPRRPAGSYSRTKGEAERLALALATPGFAVISIRPRFVWGRDDTTALPHLIAAVKSGKFAWIAGGRYRTSTTHIANLAAAIELALTRGKSGEAYFIADEEPVEFRSFVTAMLNTQSLQPPNKTVPRGLLLVMATIGDLLVGVTRGRFKPPISKQEFATSAVEVTLDTRKARRELGYVPAVSIADGMAELSEAHGVSMSVNPLRPLTICGPGLRKRNA